MDAARAGRLLKLLPGLGRVPVPLLFGMAGLEPPFNKTCSPSPDAHAIQSLLMSVYLDARMDSGSKPGILLQRLRTAHPQEHPRLCLAAVLRHCHQALRHARGIMPNSGRIPSAPSAGGNPTQMNPTPAADSQNNNTMSTINPDHISLSDAGSLFKVIQLAPER